MIRERQREHAQRYAQGGSTVGVRTVVVVVAAAIISKPNPPDTVLELRLLLLLLLLLCLRVADMLARGILCLCTCRVCWDGCTVSGG
jgi:hypothetical protein